MLCGRKRRARGVAGAWKDHCRKRDGAVVHISRQSETGRQATQDGHGLGTGEKPVFSETIMFVFLFS